MGLKTDEINETGEDVVRSGLADAYETGFSSYGDRPDDQRTLESAVTFKSNDVSKFSSDIHQGKVDPNRHQKIASFQFEIEEIPRIKDLIHARFVEEAIDRSIVKTIVEKARAANNPAYANLPISDANRALLQTELEKYDGLATQKDKEFATIDQVTTSLNDFVAAISEFERIMAKGNFLKNAEKFSLGSSSYSGNHFFQFMRGFEKYPQVFWEKFSHGDYISPKLPASFGTTSAPGVLQKLSFIMVGDESLVYDLAKLQTTALIAQIAREIEIIMDYGLPEKFFINTDHGAFSPRPTMLDKLGAGLDSLVGYYANPYIYGAKNTGNPSEKDILSLYQPMCNLFGYRHSAEVAGIDGSDAQGVHSLPGDTTRQEGNPIFSLPKEAIASLSKQKAKMYLASIIERELYMSAGIGYIGYDAGRYEHFERALGEEEANLVMPKTYAGSGGEIGVVSRVSDHQGVEPLGTKLFGTLKVDNQNGESHRVHEWIENAGYLLRPFKQLAPGVDIEEYAGTRVMPFELVSGNEEIKGNLLGPHTESFKTFIIDRLTEDFENIGTVLDTHKQLNEKIIEAADDTAAIIHTMTPDFGRAGNSMGDSSLPLAGPSSGIARKIISRAYNDIAETYASVEFALPAHQKRNAAKQSVYQLVALGSLLVPEGVATDNQRHIKKLFIERLCEIDQSKYARVGLPDHDPLAVETVGYSVIESQQRDLAIKFQGETFNKPRHSPAFREAFLEKFVHISEPYYNFAGIEYPGLAQFSRSYFDICLPQSAGYFLHERDHIMLPGSGYAGAGGYNSTGYRKLEGFIKAIANTYPNRPTNTTSEGTFVATTTEDSFLVMTGNPNGGSAHDVTYLLGDNGTAFINSFMGPGGFHEVGSTADVTNHSKFLVMRILKTVDYIINEEYDPLTNTGLPSNNLCRGGATFANGMDKSQLIAYVLEIYSIIASDIVDAHFIHSQHASAVNYENMTSVYSGAVIYEGPRRFCVSTPGGSVGSTHLTNHLIGISPKSASVEFDIGTLEIDVENSPTAKEYTQIIGFMGSACSDAVSAGKTYSEYYGECRAEMMKLFGASIVNKSKIFFTNLGTPDILLGGETSLFTVFQMYKELVEHECVLPYAFSCLAELLGYHRKAQKHGVGTTATNETVPDDEYEETLTQTIQDLSTKMSDTNLSADLVNDYIKKASARNAIELGNIHTRAAEALQDDSGYDKTTGNFSLMKSCDIVLNSFKNSSAQFANVVILGLSLDSQRDAAIREINKDAMLSSDFYELQAIYNIDFSKTSELNTFLDFTQNKDKLPTLQFNAGYTTSLYWINKGAEFLSANATMQDLVESTYFFQVKNDLIFSNILLADFGYKTGEQIIESAAFHSGDEAASALRKQLETEVTSKVMMYIFELLTKIPVFGSELSYKKLKTISRATMHTFLRMYKLSNHKASIRDDLNVDEVIDALFETDDLYEGAIADPIRFIRSEEKMSEAFKPVLIREGNETRWDPPPVSQEVFSVVQALAKSMWMTISTNNYKSCIDEFILGGKVFDTVVALTTKNLFVKGAYIPEVSSAATEQFGEQLSFVDGTLIHDEIDGDFKINNHSAMISQKLQKIT